jgi:hypothetical protein
LPVLKISHAPRLEPHPELVNRYLSAYGGVSAQPGADGGPLLSFSNIIVRRRTVIFCNVREEDFLRPCGLPDRRARLCDLVWTCLRGNCLSRASAILIWETCLAFIVGSCPYRRSTGRNSKTGPSPSAVLSECIGDDAPIENVCAEPAWRGSRYPRSENPDLGHPSSYLVSVVGPGPPAPSRSCLRCSGRIVAFPDGTHSFSSSALIGGYPTGTRRS